MGWKKQDFAVKTRGVNEPADRAVHGWVNGRFGLDRRRYFDTLWDRYGFGWMITHLPTGLIVRGVQDKLSVAKKLADEIAALDGGWDFTDPEAARAYGPRVGDIQRRNQFALTDSSNFDPPRFLDQGGE